MNSKKIRESLSMAEPWLAAICFAVAYFAATFLLFLPAILPSPLRADPAFSFLKFTGLRSGDKFDVLANVPGRGQVSVGSGEMMLIDSGRMKFKFKVSILGREVSGDVSVKFLRSQGANDLLLLQYSGRDNGRELSLSENVRADAKLAAGNILTFSYDHGSKFFQLSRDSGGKNKMITDWGACTLERK